MQTVKLSSDMLRNLIINEVKRSKKMKGFGDVKPTTSVKAKETEADELASTLEKHVDFSPDISKKIKEAKELKLEQAKLIKRLKEIKILQAKIAESLVDLV